MLLEKLSFGKWIPDSDETVLLKKTLDCTDIEIFGKNNGQYIEQKEDFSNYTFSDNIISFNTDCYINHKEQLMVFVNGLLIMDFSINNGREIKVKFKEMDNVYVVDYYVSKNSDPFFTSTFPYYYNSNLVSSNTFK